MIRQQVSFVDDTPEILYQGPLSKYKVARRSQDSVAAGKSREEILKFESRNRNVIRNLKLSVTFRDNVLHIFSYLLRGRVNGLTEEQYTSLEMLYDVLRRRMIPVYNMLTILPKLLNMNKSHQTKTVLSSLTKNLPPYLRCTATFLADEIESKRLDVNSLLSTAGKAGTALSYFTNLNQGAIHNKNRLRFNEDTSGYDKFSKVTRKALGPVYAKLLYELRENGLPLPQELFGLILMNLPNPKDDPVLEEHVRYLYDLTKARLIANWHLIGKDVIHRDVYTTVFSALSRILKNPKSTGITVNKAANYVYNHLTFVPPTRANPYFDYMRDLVKVDIDMGLLLSAIVPQEFDADTIRMKDRLLSYFVHGYRHKDMDQVVHGFNKYAYQDPLDLLIAFLTRITNRVPTSARNILQPATALLPALIMKKHARKFTPYVSSEIDVPILLESLKNPDLNPTHSWLTDSTVYELIAHPRTSVLLNSLIPTDKSKCITPRQCLTNTMMQTPKIKVNIPMTLTTKLQNIMHILRSTPPKRQSFSEMCETDTARDTETRSPITIELDNYAPTYGLPRRPNRVPASYLSWDKDKYMSVTGPGQDNPRDSITLEWQSNVPVDSSRERRVTTGYVPFQNDLPIEPLTVNGSSTTVTTSYLPIKESSDQISKISADHEDYSFESSLRVPNKRRPQIVQPYLLDSIAETTPTEYSSEIDYMSILEGSVVPRRKERRPQYPRPKQSAPPNRSETLHNDDTTRANVVSNQRVNPRKPRFQRLPKRVHRITKEKQDSPVWKPSQEIHRKKQSHQPHHHNVLQSIMQKIPVSVSSSSLSLSSSSSSSESTENENVNLNVNFATATGDDWYDKPKPSTSKKLPKTRENGSIAVLPPFIKPDQPLEIQLSDNGVPVVTMGGNSETVSGLVLPEIKELLRSPNLNNPLNDAAEPIVEQVLHPLSVILGKNYVLKILKDVDSKLYPTNVSLLLALLKKAKNIPQVTKNVQLNSLIHKYIASMEYVSPTILLPLVISSKKLKSDIVYSTFNPNDAIHIDISEHPPDETTNESIDGAVTVPLVNPKTWLQSVDSTNPYSGLLPTLSDGNPLEVALRPLKDILTTEKITVLLGPDFQPMAYPNKGALLITLLHKLRTTKRVRSNPTLKALIDRYILAIELPSTHTQVSEDSLVKMMSESKGYWQPELTSLILTLPIARNDEEFAMLETMEKFLSNPIVLEKLQIETPSSTMSRGEFLHKIILSALAGDTRLLDKQVLKALRYYRNKVEFTDMGALPIMWMWVEVYVVKAEIQLGSMIQRTLDFNKLAYKEKLAYNDVISYLAENPQLLQNNNDFDFERYKTQGEFVRALFQYIMRKPQVNGKIKTIINTLLPRVKLTGAGAVALPSFTES